MQTTEFSRKRGSTFAPVLVIAQAWNFRPFLLFTGFPHSIHDLCSQGSELFVERVEMYRQRTVSIWCYCDCDQNSGDHYTSETGLDEVRRIFKGTQFKFSKSETNPLFGQIVLACSSRSASEIDSLHPFYCLNSRHAIPTGSMMAGHLLSEIICSDIRPDVRRNLQRHTRKKVASSVAKR
jgi:hypothetical protein